MALTGVDVVGDEPLLAVCFASAVLCPPAGVVAAIMRLVQRRHRPGLQVLALSIAACIVAIMFAL